MPATRPRSTLGAGAPRARRRWWSRGRAALVAAAALAMAGASFAVAGADEGGGHHRFRQLNLVSDIGGVARVTDTNLVNPWGLAAGPSTPLWVSDNGTDVSTLYSGGVHGSIPVVAPLVVAIPGGAPTGVVFNPGTGFVVHAGGAQAPARFIFDSEAGQITAWSPMVPPSTEAQPEADHARRDLQGPGDRPDAGRRPALRGGLPRRQDRRVRRAVRAGAEGGRLHRPQPARRLRAVQHPGLGDRLYVAYAKQDADAEDEVAGAGLGFVDVYDRRRAPQAPRLARAR